MLLAQDAVVRPPVPGRGTCHRQPRALYSALMLVDFVRRMFVYEYFTGGGTYSDATANGPESCIVGEGAAMVTALACDFQAIPGTEVVVLRDARLPDWPLAAGSSIAIHNARQERDAFAELARQCDATVIIAPEQNQALLERTRWAEAVGARLLCPDSEFVAIASDKNRTADRLSRHGVPVPAGIAFQPGTPLPSGFLLSGGAQAGGWRRIDRRATAGWPCEPVRCCAARFQRTTGDLVPRHSGQRCGPLRPRRPANFAAVSAAAERGRQLSVFGRICPDRSGPCPSGRNASLERP